MTSLLNLLPLVLFLSPPTSPTSIDAVDESTRKLIESQVLYLKLDSFRDDQLVSQVLDEVSNVTKYIHPIYQTVIFQRNSTSDISEPVIILQPGEDRLPQYSHKQVYVVLRRANPHWNLYWAIIAYIRDSPSGKTIEWDSWDDRALSSLTNKARLFGWTTCRSSSVIPCKPHTLHHLESKDLTSYVDFNVSRHHLTSPRPVHGTQLQLLEYFNDLPPLDPSGQDSHFVGLAVESMVHSRVFQATAGSSGSLKTILQSKLLLDMHLSKLATLSLNSPLRTLLHKGYNLSTLNQIGRTILKDLLPRDSIGNHLTHRNKRDIASRASVSNALPVDVEGEAPVRREVSQASAGANTLLDDQPDIRTSRNDVAPVPQELLSLPGEPSTPDQESEGIPVTITLRDNTKFKVLGVSGGIIVSHKYIPGNLKPHAMSGDIHFIHDPATKRTSFSDLAFVKMGPTEVMVLTVPGGVIHDDHFIRGEIRNLPTGQDEFVPTSVVISPIAFTIFLNNTASSGEKPVIVYVTPRGFLFYGTFFPGRVITTSLPDYLIQVGTTTYKAYPVDKNKIHRGLLYPPMPTVFQVTMNEDPKIAYSIEKYGFLIEGQFLQGGEIQGDLSHVQVDGQTYPASFFPQGQVPVKPGGAGAFRLTLRDGKSYLAFVVSGGVLIGGTYFPAEVTATGVTIAGTEYPGPYLTSSDLQIQNDYNYYGIFAARDVLEVTGYMDGAIEFHDQYHPEKALTDVVEGDPKPIVCPEGTRLSTPGGIPADKANEILTRDFDNEFMAEMINWKPHGVALGSQQGLDQGVNSLDNSVDWYEDKAEGHTVQENVIGGTYTPYGFIDDDGMGGVGGGGKVSDESGYIDDLLQVALSGINAAGGILGKVLDKVGLVLNPLGFGGAPQTGKAGGSVIHVTGGKTAEIYGAYSLVKFGAKTVKLGWLLGLRGSESVKRQLELEVKKNKLNALKAFLKAHPPKCKAIGVPDSGEFTFQSQKPVNEGDLFGGFFTPSAYDGKPSDFLKVAGGAGAMGIGVGLPGLSGGNSSKVVMAGRGMSSASCSSCPPSPTAVSSKVPHEPPPGYVATNYTLPVAFYFYLNNVTTTEALIAYCVPRGFLFLGAFFPGFVITTFHPQWLIDIGDQVFVAYAIDEKTIRREPFHPQMPSVYQITAEKILRAAYVIAEFGFLVDGIFYQGEELPAQKCIEIGGITYPAEFIPGDKVPVLPGILGAYRITLKDGKTYLALLVGGGVLIGGVFIPAKLNPEGILINGVTYPGTYMTFQELRVQTDYSVTFFYTSRFVLTVLGPVTGSYEYIHMYNTLTALITWVPGQPEPPPIVFPPYPVGSIYDGCWLGGLVGGTLTATGFVIGGTLVGGGAIVGTTLVGLGNIVGEALGLVGNIVNGTLGTVGNILGATVGGAAHVVDATLGTAVNVVDATLGTAANVVGGTVNAAANVVGGTVNAAANIVGGTVGLAANLAGGVLGMFFGGGHRRYTPEEKAWMAEQRRLDSIAREERKKQRNEQLKKEAERKKEAWKKFQLAKEERRKAQVEQRKKQLEQQKAQQAQRKKLQEQRRIEYNKRVRYYGRKKRDVQQVIAAPSTVQTDVDIFSHLGWSTLHESAEDFANSIMDSQTTPFTGIGDCDLRPPTLEQLETLSTPEDLVDFYLRALNTYCEVFTKKRLTDLVHLGHVKVTSRKTFAPISPLRSKAKLTERDLEILSRSVEISSFSNTYLNALSSHSNSPFPSIEFTRTFALNYMSFLGKYFTTHQVKLQRNLLRTLQTLFTKSLQDYFRTKYCEQCDKALAHEEPFQLLSLITFLSSQQIPSYIPSDIHKQYRKWHSHHKEDVQNVFNSFVNSR